ncbi:hypothetical protein [Myroides odoratus]|uniref:hypothetical protein n=1 Tax=Myroides odoratus TaxID=256 RepID=UPI0033422480
MINLHPKEKLKEISKQYPADQRGYSYLSHYANTLKYLITRWKESEDNRIDRLYFLELKLDDFIDDDLPELNRVQQKNLKKSRQVISLTNSKLMKIAGDFLNMFDEYYKDKASK